jgi:hypothetical protein
MKTKVSIAAKLAAKGISHPIIVKIAREYNGQNIQQDSWVCCGAGELAAELFFYNALDKRVLVGELAGDNGQNRFYNPSGKAWMEDLSDLSDAWHLWVFSEVYSETDSDEAVRIKNLRAERAARKEIEDSFLNKLSKAGYRRNLSGKIVIRHVRRAGSTGGRRK